MTRQAIATNQAPAAIGPYSQAILTDGFLFCSGSLGMDPTSGELAEGVEAQATRALKNLEALLSAAELTTADVVKTTVFLVDMADFAAFNAIYATFFPSPHPARTTIAVAALPKNARIEIEAIAYRHSSRGA